MSSEVDILILAAHPDDAELFCGGTIIKMKSLGYRVGIADMTQGESATIGTVAERQSETEEASKILGIDFRTNLNLPDSHLEDNQTARTALVSLIRKSKPKLMIAPFSNCRHPDHSALHDLAKSAHFFSGAGKFPVDEEPYRPEKLIFHPEYHNDKPDFVIDISDVFDKKLAAIQAYKSQFFTADSPDDKPTFIGSQAFQQRMITRFAWYGSLINTAYGEAYYLNEGTVRIDDPLKTLSGIL